MVSNRRREYGNFAFVMTLQRRIVDLCSQAVAEQDLQELESILAELRIALHEHHERLKKTLAEYPVPVPIE